MYGMYVQYFLFVYFILIYHLFSYVVNVLTLGSLAIPSTIEVTSGYIHNILRVCKTVSQKAHAT